MFLTEDGTHIKNAIAVICLNVKLLIKRLIKY